MLLNRIAFLYNVRHNYPDPNEKEVRLDTDFDDPATIEWMIKHFKNLGLEVLPIEADEKAYLNLYENKDKIDLAFNFAEGLHGRDRECHIPAMLEMLKIPYTGGSPLTEALVLDKATAKDVLRSHGVPVLPHQVFLTETGELNPELKFPLIVKTNSQGLSAGITNDSVVENENELRRQLKFVISNFKQKALVEPFLNGREFSVPMLGNNPPEVLPIIESDHSTLPAGLRPIDSLDVKWIIEEASGGANFICPAKIDSGLEEKIKKICLQTWEVLRLCDFCRIDIRCDRAGNPYVLEVNSPAGLIPPEVSMTSYFPLSARVAGMDYETLLKKIFSAACHRYGITY
ncbi:MAG: D-alanine--D-alanine ligase [Candidatus Magasanikbacteria bacterium]|nr:D-alanine--D-alanine ligase [Candidatus Magasanikbacteria bacterium]